MTAPGDGSVTMAAWLYASLVFTVFVALATFAFDRVQRSAGRGTRTVWAGALFVAVCWPLLVPVMHRLAPGGNTSGFLFTPPSGTAALPLDVVSGDAPLLGTIWSGAITLLSLPSGARGFVRGVDAQLAGAGFSLQALLLWSWVLLSVVLLARLMLAAWRVHRLTAAAHRTVIDGEPVLLAAHFGPASVGWRTPRIVVPAWVASLALPLRTLVLRHEREHCRAHDPRYVWMSALAVVLVPWNAGVWWLARRLRLALELDCDRRTLQGGDATLYAKLLLFMSHQHPAVPAQVRLASSLASSRSHLSRRIHAMQHSLATTRYMRVGLVSLATLAVIGACATRIPGNITSPGNGSAVAVAAPDSASALASKATAQEPYLEFQVEKPAVMQPGRIGMTYPPELRAARVQGTVLASFVVDEQGVADMRTFKVLRSDHEQFTDAVRAAVGDIRYLPAEIGGKRVKQLVQQPFQFALATGGNPPVPPAAAPASTPPAAPPAPTPPAARAIDTPAKPPAPYFEFQVQPATMLTQSEAPQYPPALREAKVEGNVLASYVVNADGSVDAATFKVLKSDHEAFTAAVRAALAGMRYTPAMAKEKAVRQLVQQRFAFSLDR